MVRTITISKTAGYVSVVYGDDVIKIDAEKFTPSEVEKLIKTAINQLIGK